LQSQLAEKKRGGCSGCHISNGTSSQVFKIDDVLLRPCNVMVQLVNLLGRELFTDAASRHGGQLYLAGII
jgi:hypothetical protein